MELLAWYRVHTEPKARKRVNRRTVKAKSKAAEDFWLGGG